MAANHEITPGPVYEENGGGGGVGDDDEHNFLDMGEHETESERYSGDVQPESSTSAHVNGGGGGQLHQQHLRVPSDGVLEEERRASLDASAAATRTPSSRSRSLSSPNAPGTSSSSHSLSPLQRPPLPHPATLSTTYLAPPSNMDSAEGDSVTVPIPLTNWMFIPTRLGRKKFVDLVGSGGMEDMKKDDFEISADATFVETHDSTVALTLKKLYDSMYGVGLSGASSKSLYVITSYTSEKHTAPVFRISYREPPPTPSETPVSPHSHSSGGKDGGRAISFTKSTGGKLSAIANASVQVFKSSTRERDRDHDHATSPRTTGTLSSSWASSHSSSVRSKKTKLHKKRSMAGLAMSLNLGTAGPSAGGGGRSRSGTTSSLVSAGGDSADFGKTSPSSSSRTRPGFGHGHGQRREEMRAYGSAGAGVDLFAELLGWDRHRRTASTRSGSGDRGGLEPFGEDVHFDSPSSDKLGVESPIHLLLRSEHTVRPVQSFDSNLTARAGNTNEATDYETNSTLGHGTISASPLPPTVKFHQEIFDVLQWLTGIKHRDRDTLGDNASNLAVTPQDDPRFVIWGTREQHAESPIKGLHFDRHSFTSRGDDDQAKKRMIVAASIERWVAQLTSLLDYDELLNFYLTYRSFITPLDLCQLLICRFQWSLGTAQGGPSTLDVRIRQIVRVRTFIAIRYWLLTFFTVDFMPNREMRMLFAGWLNTSAGVAAKESPDALIILDKLRKITRECRDAHVKKSSSATAAEYRQRPGSLASQSQPYLPLSEKEGPRMPPGLYDAGITETDENFVDLDFEKNRMGGPDDTLNSSVHQRLDLANSFSPLSLQGAVGSMVIAGPGNAGGPIAAGMMLQTPLHMKLLASAQSPASGVNLNKATRATLPSLPQHSAISRAFLNTVGRLGRWRRELNSRSRNTAPLGCGAGDFDADADDNGVNGRGGDMMASRQRLDQFLETMNVRQEQLAGPQPERQGEQPVQQSSAVQVRVSPADDSPEHEATAAHADEEGEAVLDISARASQVPSIAARSENGLPTSVLLEDRPPSQYNGSGSESDRPATWQPEIVSLDDYDLSSGSDQSDYGVPLPENGNRRVPKRLPLRRDFELVRRDSVSSLGARSPVPPSLRNSEIGRFTAEGAEFDHETGSPLSPSRVNSQLSHDSDNALGSIKMWQLEVMMDNLSEADHHAPGDAEEALRKLEGQIDSTQQSQKENRVDGWLKTVRDRLEAGDVDDTADDAEEAASEVTTDDDLRTPDDGVVVESPVTVGSEEAVIQLPGDGIPWEVGSQDIASTPNLVDESHTPVRAPSSSKLVEYPQGSVILPPVSSKFAQTRSLLPRFHRSFILAYSSDELAKQWCLIDRDFFLALKFEELTLEGQDWMKLKQHDDLTDWSLFMKERMKLKVEARVNPEITAPTSITCSRLRFNVMVNFVASEIVLTAPGERLNLVSKFIRLAWKSYMIQNFHAVVSIMTGLQTRWVVQAMGKAWNKIGFWESRLFADLQVFASHADDFTHIRQSLAALSSGKPDVKNDTSGNRSALIEGPEKADPVHGGVPFFGIYLSQLSKHNRLPDLVDPTSPTSRLPSSNGISGQPSLSRPEIFDNLKALPVSMELAPLINVHKQRLIAGVIKSLVAGQHIASRVNYPIDAKLYWKCVKIKCLDTGMLERLATLTDTA